MGCAPSPSAWPLGSTSRPGCSTTQRSSRTPSTRQGSSARTQGCKVGNCRPVTRTRGCTSTRPTDGPGHRRQGINCFPVSSTRPPVFTELPSARGGLAGALPTPTRCDSCSLALANRASEGTGGHSDHNRRVDCRHDATGVVCMASMASRPQGDLNADAPDGADRTQDKISTTQALLLPWDGGISDDPPHAANQPWRIVESDAHGV